MVALSLVARLTIWEMVRSRRRAAAISLFGGSATVILSAAAALILIPFFLVYLGSELYGAWLGSGGILAWLAVLDLGLASLMIQRIAGAHGRRDFPRVGEYFSTGLALQIGLVLVLLGAAVLVAPYFPSWMGVEGSDATALSTAFVLAAIANGINILNNGVVGFLKALQITFLPNAISIVGVIVGALATLLLLLTGFGLLSIPAGLILGAGLQFLVNGTYSMLVYRREIQASLRPSRKTCMEFLAVSGPMLASKISTAAMARSDATLIAIFLRPELATAYVLTRRAADFALRLLDLVGGAAFAPFAHLVGGRQRGRGGDVHREIMQGYIGAGVIMVGAFFAGNAAFVELWVGPEQFLGQGLTVLIGMAVLFGGVSAILNYLLGATGQIAMSAWINVAEAAVRFLAMLALLVTLGVAGLPGAVLLTAPVAAWISARRTFSGLSASGSPLGGSMSGYAVYVTVLAGGALLGVLLRPESWAGVTLLVAGYVAVAGTAITAAVPSAREILVPRRLHYRL